jgi:hypothetical protein
LQASLSRLDDLEVSINPGIELLVVVTDVSKEVMNPLLEDLSIGCVMGLDHFFFEQLTASFHRIQVRGVSARRSSQS